MEQQVATFAGFGRHGLSPETVHDEDARSNFMMDLYRHLGANAGAGRREVFEGRVKPAFVKQHGRAPADRHEVRKAVKGDPYFQFWGHLRVLANQTLFYENSQTVERQLDTLIERAKPRNGEKGNLELDPNLEIPKYQSALDIHWMPGSFYTETTEDDVAAGAMFARTILTSSQSGFWIRGVRSVTTPCRSKRHGRMLR